MSSNAVQPAGPVRSRTETVLIQYVTVLSLVMMVLGLRQWAVILGILSSPGGPFEQMTAEWATITMHIAVVDVVVAVGLWNQAAWGKVLWVYAALFEITIHTVFIGTYGSDIPLVAFHGSTLVIFLLLTILVRRWAPR